MSYKSALERIASSDMSDPSNPELAARIKIAREALKLPDPIEALDELLEWVFETNKGQWNSLTTPDVVVAACYAVYKHMDEYMDVDEEIDN